MAIIKENVEIIKLLLSNDKIDVNILNILNLFYIKFKIISLIGFEIINFNEIHNHIF